MGLSDDGIRPSGCSQNEMSSIFLFWKPQELVRVLECTTELNDVACSPP